MAETKHIIVLANSKRAGGYCVAGKEIISAADGPQQVGAWIRLSDPNDAQGAVPYSCTLLRQGGATRPLDVIKVALRSPCNNPDHPEDWFFEPAQRWELGE